MSFSSISFLWFLAAFLVLYAFCPRPWRQYLLLLGSLVFVACNSLLGLLWALVFAGVNFVLGVCVQRTAAKKSVLWMAVGINVLALATFKLLGVLPVGVSFYTFAFIAYLVDIGRGTVEAELDVVRFANYALFFPKFLTGPITRYGELNLSRPRTTVNNLQIGLENFVTGFAMKILIADKLAILWNELVKVGFESLPVPLAWLGIFSFSIQLYLEWQAFSLIAIGIAAVLGYRLPQNFNYPYLARSIGDFYRRWHMSLTRWFKDYVYIPLGGNRKGLPRTILNILIVWLITSLWHGMGWNFIFWGMSIGLLIVVERLWLGRFLEAHPIASHLWVLILIPLTWCCFAIGDVGELGTYFSRLFPFFGSNGNINQAISWMYFKQFFPYLALGVFFCFPLPEKLIHRFGRTWVGAVLLAAVFWYAVYELNRSGSNPFMYLNF